MDLYPGNLRDTPQPEAPSLGQGPGGLPECRLAPVAMTERYGLRSINRDLWVDLQSDLAPWTRFRKATIMVNRPGPAASTG